ncbi:MAG: hypothetical protein ACI93R_003528 [Flavobacteriales bacterium]|jgi:hypothetical protein
MNKHREFSKKMDKARDAEYSEYLRASIRSIPAVASALVINLTPSLNDEYGYIYGSLYIFGYLFLIEILYWGINKDNNWVAASMWLLWVWFWYFLLYIELKDVKELWVVMSPAIVVVFFIVKPILWWSFYQEIKYRPKE